MQIEILRKIGLTAVESKVYSEISKTDETTIGPIIKRTGLHRGTVYNAIQSLTKKGFLSFIQKEGKQYYQISGVNIFNTLIQEKEDSLIKEKKEVELLIQELKKSKDKTSNNQIETLHGIDAFKSLFLDIYDACKKNDCEYLFLGRGEEMQDAVGKEFYLYTQKLKRQMKIKCRMILDRENISHPYHKYLLGERIYLPSKHYSPTNVWVYGDTVLIVLFKTNPLINIRIKNLFLAEGFKNYFENIWELKRGEQRAFDVGHLINFYSFMSEATESLDVMGISGLSSIHEGRVAILNLLKAGKPIRILLANPKSRNFKKRVKLEEQFISDVGESRILFEWKATVSNLKDVVKRVGNSSLQIRLFDDIPCYTVIIVDDEKALFNKYGSKSGQYGRTQKTLLVEKCNDKEFRTAKETFERYWKNAKPMKLT